MNKHKTYKRVNGRLDIFKDGDIFIHSGGLSLKLMDDETITIPIKTLRLIIKDVKEGVI